jgi:hypothetical protein
VLGDGAEEVIVGLVTRPTSQMNHERRCYPPCPRTLTYCWATFTCPAFRTITRGALLCAWSALGVCRYSRLSRSTLATECSRESASETPGSS